jgi:hypothetical protein
VICLQCNNQPHPLRLSCKRADSFTTTTDIIRDRHLVMATSCQQLLAKKDLRSNLLYSHQSREIDTLLKWNSAQHLIICNTGNKDQGSRILRVFLKNSRCLMKGFKMSFTTFLSCPPLTFTIPYYNALQF